MAAGVPHGDGHCYALWLAVVFAVVAPNAPFHISVKSSGNCFFVLSLLADIFISQCCVHKILWTQHCDLKWFNISLVKVFWNLVKSGDSFDFFGIAMVGICLIKIIVLSIRLKSNFFLRGERSKDLLGFVPNQFLKKGLVKSLYSWWTNLKAVKAFEISILLSSSKPAK